jgi:hypothetical protein
MRKICTSLFVNKEYHNTLLFGISTAGYKNCGRQGTFPAMVGALTELNRRYIWLQNLQKDKQNIEAGSKKIGGSEYRQTSYTLTDNKHECFSVLG